MRAKLDRDIFVLPRCLQPAIGPIPTNGAAQQSLSAENGQRTVLFPVNCELDTMRTLMTATTLSTSQYQQARLARDARFDGLFFVAVKTTGIFCRPICPANAPKEANVEYFANAALAANAGYRPCLRCRPDSAPGSCAWQGSETSFQRALSLIDQGALQNQTLAQLAERLGISDRYLRALFQKHLGLSPKFYAQFQQLMFAKQLLHDSQMSVADIALASGFQSIRRFNDAFKSLLKLTPSEVRKRPALEGQQLLLAYRPPLNWSHLLDFYQRRLVDNVEKIEGLTYRRNVHINKATGWFSVTPYSNNTLLMKFAISDVRELRNLVNRVRRMLDLDADLTRIEQHLMQTALRPLINSGLRIPGVWSTWEAGVRAIVGQQVSVKAAIGQLNLLVQSLAAKHASADQHLTMFPTPDQVAQADLSFLKMPNSRKQTLHRFAQYMTQHADQHPQQWLSLKGIGPWTINYAQLRGLSEPNCFLATDLVVKKALAKHNIGTDESFSPWGSYATFHCWNAQT